MSESSDPGKRDSDNADDPLCLNCGHEFDLGELAAMTAIEGHDDQCVIDCASCGAHNVVRTKLQGGLDQQPVTAVLRTVDSKPDTAAVFDETVEPGVDVHPITRGESG